LVRLTVVFVDVRGFSALSEKTEPAIIVEKLNRFYRLAAQSVFTLDGTLDKMVGDGVMAFFGAPFQPEDHALGRCSQNWRLCQAFSPVQKILKDYPLVVALPQAKYSWET
jgi:class 3 adenylate cyclase